MQHYRPPFLHEERADFFVQIRQKGGFLGFSVQFANCEQLASARRMNPDSRKGPPLVEEGKYGEIRRKLVSVVCETPTKDDENVRPEAENL